MAMRPLRTTAANNAKMQAGQSILISKDKLCKKRSELLPIWAHWCKDTLWPSTLLKCGTLSEDSALHTRFKCEFICNFM